MICPHCLIGVSIDFEESAAFRDKSGKTADAGIAILWDVCPECEKPIIKLQKGVYSGEGFWLSSVDEEQVLYPLFADRYVDSEVPSGYSIDYREASAVLSISPKASAALSRRILQAVLQNELEIKGRSLADEIKTFVERVDTPSYLGDAVDAVRNVGNFAAHPSKDQHTGEIVEVEPGEAEWLLEVLDALFDFVFVQPKKLERRKEKLNKKLKAMGKPEMK